ncbi:MAG: class B sortase [Lachnospiraceae bacterium]|jgi:sortase B|nr:class B sortase [Lachnospiraceae bacterium]
MGKVYCIGKFEFDSYAEYQEALDDIEKIRYMSKKMDINEPGVAQRLYTLIREGKIVFKSVIGDDYLLYLSDLVAEDYRSMSRNSFGRRMTKRLQQVSPSQVIGALCMAGAVVCFLIFLGSEYRDQQKAKELEQLKSEQEISAASGWLSSKLLDVLKKPEMEEDQVVAETKTVENEVHAAEFTEPEGPKILSKYQKLYEKNSDFAGWITIPGTEIDYPVMQAVSESSEFYLDHDFDGKSDINGSIFLDSRNDLENPNDNMVVYGHNMKSGMMFGGLKEYLDKNYWQEHKSITFDTIYEEAEYEIIAVCLSKVEEDDSSFKYYDFIDAGNKKAFKRYVENIKALNIMDEDIEVSYGDKLLTLSTCNNYTKDGRLFIVAKKCEKK